MLLLRNEIGWTSEIDIKESFVPCKLLCCKATHGHAHIVLSAWHVWLSMDALLTKSSPCLSTFTDLHVNLIKLLVLVVLTIAMHVGSQFAWCSTCLWTLCLTSFLQINNMPLVGLDA